MTSQPELAEAARAMIDGNRYMTLATAGRSGQPWASPVWYAPAGYREFFWISSPAALHSRNLAERPQAGVVIFDSRAPIGRGQGVYMPVVTEEVTGADLGRAIEIFSARSQAQGGSPWTLADVRAPAQHRLYRAAATELFVLDGRDRRIRVTLRG